MIVNFDFKALNDLIQRHCGLVIFDRDLLARAVISRSQVIGVDPNRYHIRVLNNPSEAIELAAILTINETYFYRAQEQVRFMAETLIPSQLKTRRPGAPIHILSAGCSTGEEPYSIAINLREIYGPAAADLFAIHGYDLDGKALEKAKAAQYSKFSLRAIPENLISRYLTQLGTSYQLHDSIRRMVHFQRVNLTDFPPKTVEFDFVFFRNVSLYLDRASIHRVQTNLLENMAPQGVLFVGAAEGPVNDLGIFKLTHADGQFCFIREAASSERDMQMSLSAVQSEFVSSQNQVPSSPPTGLPVSNEEPVSEPSLWRISQMIRAGIYGQAEQQLARVKKYSIEKLVLESFLFFQTSRLDLAEERAADAIALNFWSLEASILCGLIARRRDDIPGAISWFGRALYECPTNWPANFFLAEIYRGQGENNSAYAHYRRTLNEIRRAPDPDGGLSIPLDFPLQEALKICRSRLAPQAERDVVHAG